MASKFKQAEKQKRDVWCRRLVSAYLPGLQNQDPANFNIAFSYVSQNLEELAPDANPRDAEDWFGSLARRCEEDSQLAKAQRIRQLVTEIKGLGIKSDYHEPESRILHLLVALAGRPMESDPDHAAALARRVREQRLAEEAAVAVAQAREEAGIIAELRAGEEDDEEAYEDDEDDGRHRRGGYGSDSTLSEWSDAEEGQEREMQQQYRRGQDAAAAAATMAAAGAEDGAGRAWPHEQAHLHVLLPPAMTAAAPQRRAPAVLPDPSPAVGRSRLPAAPELAPPGSLRARLVAAAGLPAAVAGTTPPLARTLLALLAALQGRGSEVLPWDAAAAAFVPAADAMALTADVSYGAMRAALRPLLRAATAVRRLDDWVNACLGRPAAGGGGGGAGGGGAGAGAAEGVPVPLWLLRVAGYKGLRGAAAGRGAPAVRLVAGPTLTALHQAVSSCIYVLRTSLVELEQRITTAAVAAATSASPISTTGFASVALSSSGAAPAPPLPSVYELLLSCQPFMRRAAGLVGAYHEVARPLVAALVAAQPPRPAAAAAAAAAAATAAAAAAAAAQAAGAAGAAGSLPAGGAVGAGAAAGAVAARSPQVQLQLQAGVVLQQLHALNERGWLDGVFRPLDSHAHRSLLLYLYLSALEPLLDGLGEWLWASGTSAATATATATASATATSGTAAAAPGGAGATAGAGAGATAAWLAGEGGASAAGCELPADFFIVRGGQPGREVPPDHPSFWREGYLALRRPEQAAAAAAAAAGAGASAGMGRGAGAEAGVAEGVASAGGTAGAAGGGGAGGGGGGYTCPPFLEPLVASIMAAGKSLRLRQRETDSLEAAAAATAGAAAPGYGAAGMPVLDPVELEESYAMYGLDPVNATSALGGGVAAAGLGFGLDGGAAVAGGGLGGLGGGRDLKRSIMERLLEYIAPAQATVGSSGGAGGGGGISAGGWGPIWDAAPRTPPRPGAGGSVGGAALAALPPPPASAAAASAPPAAAGSVGPAGGAGERWSRWATASSRLRAMCRPGALVGFAPDAAAASSASWASSSHTRPPHGASLRAPGAAGRGPSQPPTPLLAGGPQLQGASSPTTPLEGGGALSGASSPGEERERRRQQQQQQQQAQPGQQSGREEDEMEVEAAARAAWALQMQQQEAERGGWWPSRCQAFVQPAGAAAASAQAAMGMERWAGGGSGGGLAKSNLTGPWRRMQQLLRAGPRSHATPLPSSLSAPSRPGAPALAPLLRLHLSPANPYQHPAMEQLLLHACGGAAGDGDDGGDGGGSEALQRQQPQPQQSQLLVGAVGRSTGGGGGGWAVAAAASGGVGGGGGGPALGLPHPQELLRRGLVEPLMDRVDHINDALLLRLLGGWGLEGRLAALPALFGLSSPAARTWADGLVAGLLRGGRLGETPLDEGQLEAALHEALNGAAPDDLLPPPSSLTLQLAPPPAAEPAVASAPSLPGAAPDALRPHPAALAGSLKAGLRGSATGLTASSSSGAVGSSSAAAGSSSQFQSIRELERSVSELERLQLAVTPSWVVALVADSKALRAYGQVLVFLLQLRWVRAALDAAHKSACLAWRGAAGRQHANAFPPLRRPRGAPGPLQRSNSLGAAPASGGGAGSSLPPGPHHHQQRPQQHRGSYSGTGGLTGLAADRHGGGAAAAGGGGLLMHSHSSASILAAGGVGAAGAGLRASGGALHHSQSLSGGAAAGGGGASGVVLNAAHLSQLAAMVHFMATLEQWVVAQLVHEAWRDMEAGLAAARSLDDVCAAHSEYANTLLRRCFRLPGDVDSRNVGGSLRKCLDGALKFANATAAMTGGAAKGAAQLGPAAVNPLLPALAAAAGSAADQFNKSLSFLIRYVSARALLNPNSDLSDLLMRLNYNGIYNDRFMSEEVIKKAVASAAGVQAGPPGGVAGAAGAGAGGARGGSTGGRL